VIILLISSYVIIANLLVGELNVFIPKYISSKILLLPCKLDNANLPTLISDIRYADFTRSIEKGIQELLEAVKLNEEIKTNDLADLLINTTLAELSNGELAFTLFEIFENKNYMFIGDRRSENAPYKLLDKLCKLGLLAREGDKYEIYYHFTKAGAVAINKLYNMESKRLKKLIVDYK
jgi:hypothetical protein